MRAGHNPRRESAAPPGRKTRPPTPPHHPLQRSLLPPPPPPQRMFLRHPLLQRYVAEYFLLLVLISSHTSLYPISREKPVSFSATSKVVPFSSQALPSDSEDDRNLRRRSRRLPEPELSRTGC